MLIGKLVEKMETKEGIQFLVFVILSVHVTTGYDAIIAESETTLY